MAGHLRKDIEYSIFIQCSSPHLHRGTVTGKSGLLQMQNIPFIFKILYPNVVGRKLIYSGGSAKETSRHLARILG